MRLVKHLPLSKQINHEYIQFLICNLYAVSHQVK